MLSNGFDRLERGGLKILILGQVFIDRLDRAPWYRKDGDAFRASHIGLVAIG